MASHQLPEERRTDAVRRAQVEFHRDIVDQVRTAVERDPVVVVGMAQNPVVKKARQGLQEAGIEFTYLEYGSYLKAWKERLAIKLWSGWPTFPQVFVRGTFIGGNHEMREMLASGAFRELLEGDAGSDE